MSSLRVAIVGAGGQARETAWYLEDINRESDTYRLAGFVVSDCSRVGPRDSSERILGDYSWLADHLSEIDGIILGLGSPASRLKVAGELSNAFPGLEWPSVIHPSARLDRASASIGRGVLVAPNVVGTVGIRLADFSFVNFGCTLGHEASLGRGSVIYPGANISGGVTIGDGAMIGAGAVVLQYLDVGAEAKVGAGAVVTRDVAAGVTVVGVPARGADDAGCFRRSLT